MKKTILITILLVFFITHSFAQFSFGVKSGVNLSNARAYGNVDNTFKFGFNAGLLAHVNISKKFSIQPEVLYSEKGYDFLFKTFHVTETANLDYITVPVLFAFQPNKHFSFLAGPEFGFLTSTKTNPDYFHFDDNSEYKKFDVGADLGIAYTFIKGFGAELRFNYGFNKLAHVQLYDAAGNMLELYTAGGNRVFQFDLYYMFSVKR